MKCFSLHREFDARFLNRLERRKFCNFDMGNDAPAPAPDPAIGQAAQMSAEVAREQLAYQKERDAQLAPVFQRIVDSNLGTMDDNRTRASEQWARYKEKGIPVEDKYLDDALNYGTEADQEAKAGRAMQDTQHQFDLQQAASTRDQMRYGVNPNSGRFVGSARTLDLGRAAGTAAAGTNARENAKLLGMSMRENAAKFVRGLPTTGIAADSLALSGGNSANSTMSNQEGMHNAGISSALGANAQGASILNTQFNQQNQAYQNAQQANRDTFSGLGSIVGMGTAIASGPAWLGLAKGGEVRKMGHRGGPNRLSYANGGELSGPGTGTSDSIPGTIEGREPLRLSDGEYVVKADTTQNVYGTDTMDDVNEGKAEIIPSKVLTEIGRNQVRTLTMAMAAPSRKRAPITIEQGA